MEKDTILLEATLLADEILEHGSGAGRGTRLAALVVKLNELMLAGKVPLSWNPPAHPKSIPAPPWNPPLAGDDFFVRPNFKIPSLPPPFHKEIAPKEAPLPKEFSLPRPAATLDMGAFQDVDDSELIETIRPSRPNPDSMFSFDEINRLANKLNDR